ncbi:hypothetical protein [Sphingomonas sp.]|jgi:hypothetical protein|uniref:hypothetical protein n=1 Tax=Sphingomonas sp. TaxID=28214 RepID=UPI002EDB5D77
MRDAVEHGASAGGGIAEQMYQREHGVRPRIASEVVLRERLAQAATAALARAFAADGR